MKSDLSKRPSALALEVVGLGRMRNMRVNDRGPHVRDRIIDLSKAAAAALDLLQAGEGPVVLTGL